jgi:hypothetical protein
MSNPQDFEAQYWGDCTNTFYEERKHFVYASLMGIKRQHWSFVVPEGSRILDIGAGPCSMLLKTHGAGRRVVCDPLPYPAWVNARYALAGIEVMRGPGEAVIHGFSGEAKKPFEEVWIYNCLQHVEDPKQIVRSAMDLAHLVRIFEWIDIPAHEGHPHMLTEQGLDEWLWLNSEDEPPWDGGTVTELSHDGCFGRAYSASRYCHHERAR